MGQVTVTFHGVCVHFIGVVPGVPQRVVLPDASALRFGYVQLPGQPTVMYYLMPHFAILRMPYRGHEAFNVPHTIDRGNIIGGVHLEIPNAIGGMHGSADIQTNQLETFVPSYQYSSDVVLGGRAAAYFDLFHAAKQEIVFNNQAAQVVATIETDGPPLLRATPFAGGPSFDFPLLTVPDRPIHLWVANQGMDCDSEENSYDFLLSFLTQQGGIPRVFVKDLPGLDTAKPFKRESFDHAVDVLEKSDYPFHFDSRCFQLQPIEQPPFVVMLTSAACGNSTYP